MWTAHTDVGQCLPTSSSFFFQANYEVPLFWNHPQELGKTEDLDWKPYVSVCSSFQHVLHKAVTISSMTVTPVLVVCACTCSWRRMCICVWWVWKTEINGIGIPQSLNIPFLFWGWFPHWICNPLIQGNCLAREPQIPCLCLSMLGL